MTHPKCDHCSDREALVLCKTCGYRVCDYCRAHFELLKKPHEFAMVHWATDVRRCPECKRAEGWDPL